MHLHFFDLVAGTTNLETNVYASVSPSPFFKDLDSSARNFKETPHCSTGTADWRGWCNRALIMAPDASWPESATCAFVVVVRDFHPFHIPASARHVPEWQRLEN